MSDTTTHEINDSPAPEMNLELMLQKCKQDIDDINQFKGGMSELNNQLQQIRGAIEANKKSIANEVKRCIVLVKDAEKKSQELSETQDDLAKEIKAVKEEKTKLAGLVVDLQNLKEAAELAKATFDGHVEEVETAKEQFIKLRNETQERAKNLAETQDSLEKLFKPCQEYHNKMSNLAQAIFDDEMSDDGSIEKLSVKNSIDAVHKESGTTLDKIKQSYDQYKEDFSTLKIELKEDIHQLLPQAAAASLASAYREAKLKYGHDSTKITRQEIIHYALFIAPLLLMICIVLFFKFYLNEDLSALKPEEVVYKIMIFLPLIGISMFGLATIQLHRRLYEEYNHKQRVMQLYDGFKKEVDREGEDRQKRTLLNIMLKTVEDKPTLAMSKFEKSIWAEIISRILPEKMNSTLKEKEENS